jgi:hypothetical protein
VFLLSLSFGEDVRYVFLRMYVRIVYNLTIVEISTVVAANVDMLRPSFDDSSSDVSESTLVVAVNW